MDVKRIEGLLLQIHETLPAGATLALVIVAPADNGWSRGTVVDLGMDEDTMAFAAECLVTPGDGAALAREAVN